MINYFISLAQTNFLNIFYFVGTFTYVYTYRIDGCKPYSRGACNIRLIRVRYNARV